MRPSCRRRGRPWRPPTASCLNGSKLCFARSQLLHTVARARLHMKSKSNIPGCCEGVNSAVRAHRTTEGIRQCFLNTWTCALRQEGEIRLALNSSVLHAVHNRSGLWPCYRHERREVNRRMPTVQDMQASRCRHECVLGACTRKISTCSTTAMKGTIDAINRSPHTTTSITTTTNTATPSPSAGDHHPSWLTTRHYYHPSRHHLPEPSRQTRRMQATKRKR